MVVGQITVGVLLLAAIAEWLHWRRIRRVAGLAFGPVDRAPRWTHAVPAIRVLSVTALAWALLTLWRIAPQVAQAPERQRADHQHLILVLDVSPSMQLKDGGPGQAQTRAQRVSDVLMNVFGRILLDQVRISVVAVYSGARPVVEATRDVAVIRNILDDLPLDKAFEHGQTELIAGLREAAERAKPWPPDSTTLMVATDGVTVPDADFPLMPASVATALVIGVGDPRVGRHIDGHQSRQDRFLLRQLARRLGGAYYDCNQKNLPSKALEQLATTMPVRRETELGLREIALGSVGAAAGILALLPVALALFGTGPRAPVHTGTGRGQQQWDEEPVNP